MQKIAEHIRVRWTAGAALRRHRRRGQQLPQLSSPGPPAVRGVPRLPSCCVFRWCRDFVR